MTGKTIVLGCYLSSEMLEEYNKDRTKYNKIATSKLKESIKDGM